jgi:hypothetical protein
MRFLASAITKSHPFLNCTFVVIIGLTDLHMCGSFLGMAIDYSIMLRELLEKHSDLAAQRNKIDVETTKLTQLIKATFNMLTREQQEKAESADFEKFLESHSLGLSRAIRMAFEANKDEWMSPPQIRDYLNEVGFDFTKYVANPLTAIGTTLKRLIGFEVETKTLDNGQAVYRLRNFSPYSRLMSLSSLMAAPAPKRDKLPEEVSGKIHPSDHISKRARIAGMTPEIEAGLRETLGPSKKK